MREALTYQGKVYSVPHEASLGYSHYMYYNKLIFRKLGLPVPFVPESIDELESVLDTIAAAGVEPILFGAKDHWVSGYFSLRYFESAMYGALAQMNGGNPIEPNAAYYNGIASPSDALRAGFETLKRWQDEGWISRNSLSMTWPESFAHFAAGNAAIFPQGFWVPSMDQTLQADPEVFEIGAFYMPQESVDGNHYATGLTDKMLMVNARSKNLDQAKVLLNWLGAEENIVSYLNSRKAGGFLLPVDGVEPQPVFAEWGGHLKSLEPVTLLTVFPFIPGDEHTNYGQFSQAVLAGTTVDEALSDLDEFYAEHKGEISVPER